MVVCLERGAHLHMAQLMPLPLTVSCLASVKSRLVYFSGTGLPTQGHEMGVCAFVHASVCVYSIDLHSTGVCLCCRWLLHGCEDRASHR